VWRNAKRLAARGRDREKLELCRSGRVVQLARYRPANAVAVVLAAPAKAPQCWGRFLCDCQGAQRIEYGDRPKKLTGALRQLRQFVRIEFWRRRDRVWRSRLLLVENERSFKNHTGELFSGANVTSDLAVARPL
jgi:hypothetical protein